jgi:hypothetical protein
MICFFFLVSFMNETKAQDSLYAGKIDSLRDGSCHLKQLFRKRQRAGSWEYDYLFYRKDSVLRSMTEYNKKLKVYILYFYVNNHVVMVSPVGQQPYYILNDRFVFSRHDSFTEAEVDRLILRANEGLKNAYKRIKKI